MLTVIGLSGSLRRGSYNAAVLRAAASAMPAVSVLTQNRACLRRH